MGIGVSRERGIRDKTRAKAKRAAPLLLLITYSSLLIKELCDFVPINYIPPGCKVFRSSILVFEVISMLPKIIS
jgi:hypothetical protein